MHHLIPQPAHCHPGVGGRHQSELFGLVQVVDRLTGGFCHVTAVERVIGLKRGTSGVSCLRRRLDVVLFPEIWKLPTDL